MSVIPENVVPVYLTFTEGLSVPATMPGALQGLFIFIFFEFVATPVFT